MSQHIYGESGRIRPYRKSAAAEMIRREPTRTIELFLAGDIAHAKQIVRSFCKERPCCVTVTPTTFIYRGGEEQGFAVGVRNYPRFPEDAYSLRSLADELGASLRDALGQDSYMSVEHGGSTTWSSTRDA